MNLERMNLQAIQKYLNRLRPFYVGDAIELVGMASSALTEAHGLAPSSRDGQRRDIAAHLRLHLDRLEGQNTSAIYSEEPALKRDLLAAFSELDAARSPGPRNWDLLELVKPEQIRNEIATVDNEAQRLHADIARSDTAKAFKDAWAVFYKEWGAFYQEHHDAGWLTGLGTYRQAQGYRQRVADWRKKLVEEAAIAAKARAAGKTPEAPVSSSPKDSGAGPPKPTNWTPIAIGAGLVVAAGVAVAVAVRHGT